MAANELLLETAFLAPLIDILEGSDITRQCNTLDDLTFVTLNVLRCLQSCKTGRDFIQTHGIHCAPDLSRGNYFANLSSKRRQDLTRQIADQMRITRLPALRAFDDALGIFPELAKWEVYAADGHKMTEAYPLRYGEESESRWRPEDHEDGTPEFEISGLGATNVARTMTRGFVIFMRLVF